MSAARPSTVALAIVQPHNNFGLMRLLLALAVVVSHAFSVTTGIVEDEPLARLTGFTLGEHAVNGFFAISGFLVTMSYDRRGLRDYVVARILRIAPGLIAAVLVVALVMGPALTKLPLAAYLADASLWRFITATLTTFKSAAPLPGVFADNPLRFPMGTVWTLKYETLCYLGVIGFGLAGLFRARALALGIALALTIAVLAREIMAPDGPKGIETALRLPLIFLAGGLIYLWREKVPLSLAGLAIAIIATALLAATPLYKPALYLVTAWGVIVLSLALQLTRRATEPGADLSYGVYLYGWPVQQALVALWPMAGAWTLLGPAMALTALMAGLSWYAVEKPMLGLKRRLVQPGRIAQA
jgi:peptidoglycan/LPS O-acetylase OafA/YrhL